MTNQPTPASATTPDARAIDHAAYRLAVDTGTMVEVLVAKMGWHELRPGYGEVWHFDSQKVRAVLTDLLTQWATQRAASREQPGSAALYLSPLCRAKMERLLSGESCEDCARYLASLMAKGPAGWREQVERLGGIYLRGLGTDESRTVVDAYGPDAELADYVLRSDVLALLSSLGQERAAGGESLADLKRAQSLAWSVFTDARRAYETAERLATLPQEGRDHAG